MIVLRIFKTLMYLSIYQKSLRYAKSLRATEKLNFFFLNFSVLIFDQILISLFKFKLSQ